MKQARQTTAAAAPQAVSPSSHLTQQQHAFLCLQVAGDWLQPEADTSQLELMEANQRNHACQPEKVRGHSFISSKHICVSERKQP